jgi:hypothetical protein
MKLSLNSVAYGTAIGLAGFSGAVATYGLTKFCPGSEAAVGVMGALFEAAKLSSLALIHRKTLPMPIKCGLAAVSLTLMTANVAGVSGMLSAAYSERQGEANARHAQSSLVAESALSDLRTQLSAADASIAQSRAMVLKARDDRGRAKAAQGTLERVSAERTAIAGRLETATTAHAAGEADAIRAGGEFAALRFLAEATGATIDATAHVVILVIASVPDLAAALLLWAAGHQPPKLARVVRRKRKVTRRPKAPAQLHVVKS